MPPIGGCFQRGRCRFRLPQIQSRQPETAKSVAHQTPFLVPKARGRGGGGGSPQNCFAAAVCKPFRSVRHPGSLCEQGRGCGSRTFQAAFLTNSDFRLMALPSILQAMLWSPSCRRMFLTLVPCLMTCELPLIFRSFTSTTVSPSASPAPLASLTVRVSASVSWFQAAIRGRIRGRRAVCRRGR